MIFIIVVLFSFLIGTVLILLFGFGNNNRNNERATTDEGGPSSTKLSLSSASSQKLFIDKKTIANIKARNNKFNHVNTIGNNMFFSL